MDEQITQRLDGMEERIDYVYDGFERLFIVYSDLAERAEAIIKKIEDDKGAD